MNRLISGDERLEDYDILAVPGGFSFGDHLGSGRLLGNRMRFAMRDALQSFVDTGKPIIGICNGFQALTETGMLPGVLTRNAGLKFACRNVGLQVCETRVSPFTSGLDINKRLIIPIAHNEGNYFASDDDLQRLKDNGQIAFSYTESDITGPANPNGAARDIAGILSANGRVMGMMPHPERAISSALGSADGATMLTAALEALAA